MLGRKLNFNKFFSFFPLVIVTRICARNFVVRRWPLIFIDKAVTNENALQERAVEVKKKKTFRECSFRKIYHAH